MRIPLGVTNGVACLQRVTDLLIKEEGLTGGYAYLDDMIICGMTQEEQDDNLNKFVEAAQKKDINYNVDKGTFSTRRLGSLSYMVEDGVIRPDPERLKPLRDLPLS